MRYVGRLLKFTAKEGSEVVERRLQAAGGSLPIWLILQTLGEQEGELQRQLAERLCIEGPTMTRHLDNLAADGLIERRPDPTDRRAKRLYLTPAARPLLDRIATQVEELAETVLAGVDPAAVGIMLTQLGLARDNLKQAIAGKALQDVKRYG